MHGWLLPPVAILLCDLVVYCEFLIHPAVLLATSTKLRQEVKATIKRLSQVCKKQGCKNFTKKIS